MKKLKGKLHNGEQQSGSGNSWKELTLVFSCFQKGNARGKYKSTGGSNSYSSGVTLLAYLSPRILGKYNSTGESSFSLLTQK
jgi:hypothetical protein